MNKYQEALETIQKSKLIFHVYKGQTEGMKAPRIFDLYHGEIFTLRELVEKATPKKVVNVKSVEDWDVLFIAGECPVCGSWLNDEMKYCPECGQRLEWE